MATWSATGGAGFPAFDQWSRKSTKYDEAETRERWAQIAKSPPTDIGAGTLFYMANEEARLSRPSIDYDPTNPMRMAREAEAYLLACDRPLYQQMGKLVRVVQLEQWSEQRVVKRDAGAVILCPANTVWLSGQFMEVARWKVWRGKRGEKKEVSIALPRIVAETYGEMVGEWKLPELVGTVETPTIYKSGNDYVVLQTPGYDPVSGLYYAPSMAFPPVPDRPSKHDATVALEKFLELLREFPFVPDDASDDWEPGEAPGVVPSTSRSVVISAYLTGLLRRHMKSAPMHLFDSAAPGTGKSYIVHVVATILTGRRAAAMPWVRNEEEMRKRITSVLMAGDPVTLFDNINTSMGGVPLNILLTEGVLRDRVLGKSTMMEAPTNCLVLGTGNNIEVEADTTRRAVRCRMDARIERPQDRQFPSDPRAQALQDRGGLVVGGLTILLAYINAGRPLRGKVKHVGSYEDWTLIREAIVWLGQPDPAETMKEISADDPVASEVQQMMTAWWNYYGSSAIKLTTAVSDARRGEVTFSNSAPDERSRALYDAMQTAVRGRELNEKLMGRWFKKHDQQIVGGRRFVRGGSTSHGREIALLRSGGLPVHPVQQPEARSVDHSIPWERL